MNTILTNQINRVCSLARIILLCYLTGLLVRRTPFEPCFLFPPAAACEEKKHGPGKYGFIANAFLKISCKKLGN